MTNDANLILRREGLLQASGRSPVRSAYREPPLISLLGIDLRGSATDRITIHFDGSDDVTVERPPLADEWRFFLDSRQYTIADTPGGFVLLRERRELATLLRAEKRTRSLFWSRERLAEATGRPVAEELTSVERLEIRRSGWLSFLCQWNLQTAGEKQGEKLGRISRSSYWSAGTSLSIDVSDVLDPLLIVFLVVVLIRSVIPMERLD